MKQRARTAWPMVAGASGVRMRDRRESSRRIQEQEKIDLPFGFMDFGESLNLYQHRPREAQSVPLYTLYEGSIYKYCTTYAVARLDPNGVNIYANTTEFCDYRVEGNYLHPSNPNYPTLYFDDQGRKQKMRDEYEQRKKAREQSEREQKEFEERLAQRSMEQQRRIEEVLQQKQSVPAQRHGILRRLMEKLGVGS